RCTPMPLSDRPCRGTGRGPAEATSSALFLLDVELVHETIQEAPKDLLELGAGSPGDLYADRTEIRRGADAPPLDFADEVEGRGRRSCMLDHPRCGRPAEDRST